jgi:hypothetical protein
MALSADVTFVEYGPHTVALVHFPTASEWSDFDDGHLKAVAF